MTKDTDMPQSTLTWMIPDLKPALQACDTQVFAKGTIDFLKANVLSAPDSPDIATALYRLLGGEGALPRAALLALYYDLPVANAWLLCEPVELTDSKRDVVCLGNAHLALTLTEAEAFATTFNQYWEGTGMMLYTPTPTQWLLALQETPGFHAPSLRDVLNQNVAQHIPTGNMSAWRHLFSQAQMLMQGHPVNRSRVGVLPLVNGLWISGEGQLMTLEKKPHLRVMSDTPEVIAVTHTVMGKTVPSCDSFDAFWSLYGSSQEEHIITLSCESVGAVSYEDYFETLENRWLKSYVSRERMKIPS
jgi:hypothetical protein